MVLPALSRGLFQEMAKSQEALERQRQENEAWKRGDITQVELGLRTGANLLDAAVNPMIGKMLEPVAQAGSSLAGLVPASVPQALARSETMAPVFETVKKGVQRYEELKRESPRTARNIEAALKVAEYIPTLGGAKMTTEAAKTVDALTGPESAGGMLTASANNVITGYYSGNPAAAAMVWAPDQLVNTIRDLVSPESRAMYREQGLTRSSQKIIAQARARETFIDSWTKIPGIKQLLEKTGLRKYLSSDKEEGMHRGIAQAQYLGRVHAQSERKGKADFIDEVMRRSDIVETFEYYPGSYAETIRNQKLVPYYKKEGSKKQMPLRMASDDLDFIEQHFSTVWTEPSLTDPDVMVPFKEAERPLLAIKTAGAGNAETGRHYADVLLNAPYAKKVDRIFEGVARVSPEELLARLSDEAAASQKLKEDKFKFSVVGQSKDGGVWISGSRPGSAITEGGINYLTKVTPDGKLIGIMSDEHNLFEGISARIEKYSAGAIPALSMMKHFLPRRLIAVTPPMVMEVGTKTSKKREYAQPKAVGDKRTHISLLDDIIDYKPSKEVLEAERKRNLGAATTTVGLSLIASEEEQEGP